MAARIVAVNAPGTLAQGFGGEPTAFEICLIVKIGDSEEWSVLEAFDEGRSGTGSSGSVLYKKEAGAARSGACPPVICALDGAVFGPGMYDLTPAGRNRIDAATATATAAKKRPHEEPAGAAASAGGEAKVARVTDLAAALGRNEAGPSTLRDGTAKKTTMQEDAMIQLGMRPGPRTFTMQDREHWTVVERRMYNSQNQIHGAGHATAFMRRYFIENEGKPLAPKKAPRSAFNIYKQEEFAKLGCNANGTKGEGKKKKNYSKQVGAAWKVLGEQETSRLEAIMEKLQEEYEAAAGVYEVSLEEWEKEKESRKRAAAADAVA